MKIGRGVGMLTGKDARGWTGADRPSVTLTGTMESREARAGWVEVEAGEAPPPTTWRPPTMADVRAANGTSGYKVASTFSGCGGSCVGYRLAGYSVVWASEFLEHAVEVYKLNCEPYTVVDDRDVREVTAADILGVTGLEVGQLDLFDGSPPCSQFSTAGHRDANWGKVVEYHGRKQRVDDLFMEYARLVRELQPRTFVAENVSGLVKGRAKGYFKLIMRELESCGYVVGAQLLDAKWLGVPQARQRVYIVGVREDLGLVPRFPKPEGPLISVREAIGDLVIEGSHYRHGGEWDVDRASPTVTSNGFGCTAEQTFSVIHDNSGWVKDKDVTDGPCPTITSGKDGMNRCHFTVKHNPNDKSYCAGKEWDVDEPSRAFMGFGVGGARMYQVGVEGPNVERRRFTIAEVKRLCSFPDDFQMSGSKAKRWARLGCSVPPLMARAVGLSVREVLDEARRLGR